MDIVEKHLLERKLVGIWEIVSDDYPSTVEAYVLSLEGFFLEIETMLDSSSIGIASWHYQVDFPDNIRPGCFCNDVSHDTPYSKFLGKRLSKCRLLIGENDNWEGLLLDFDTSPRLLFISENCSLLVFTLKGTNYQ